MIFHKKSHSSYETKKIGRELAGKILKLSLQKKAVIISLAGELGSGKTCFVQGIAAGLKIREKILSPTFIIFRSFKIKEKRFKSFYHFDCYRIKDPKELFLLDFEEIISNPANIVAIEWPERIKKILPKNRFDIKFKFIDQNTREIIIQNLKLKNQSVK